MDRDIAITTHGMWIPIVGSGIRGSGIVLIAIRWPLLSVVPGNLLPLALQVVAGPARNHG